MAKKNSSTYRVGDVQKEAQSGKSYVNMSDGSKLYLSPRAVDPYTTEEAPKGSFLRSRGEWDTKKGEWKRPINWSNILSAATGGAIAAPFVAGAVGAGAAGGGASAGASAAGSSIPLIAPASVLPAASSGILSSIPTLAATQTVPFTGSLAAGGGGKVGMLSKIGQYAKKGYNLYDKASNVSDVLGQAAKSGQAANQVRDATRLSQESLRLGRDRFATEAPGQRLRTALRAALAKGSAPTTVTWGGPGSGLRGEVPTYSRPSLQDPSFQALIQQILEDELMAQRQGGTAGGGDRSMGAPLGRESRWDKILGGASLGSSLIGAMKAKTKKVT